MDSNNVLDCLLTRRSIRKYKTDLVPREALAQIAACGHSAPTGVNRQPWRIVLVDDPALKERIAALCHYGAFIREAGACIAVFSADPSITPLEDCCAATMNMITAAWALGYGTCWVNSHNREHSEPVGNLLGCPPDWQMMTLIAVGVPDERPVRRKKPLDEVCFYNHVDV